MAGDEPIAIGPHPGVAGGVVARHQFSLPEGEPPLRSARFQRAYFESVTLDPTVKQRDGVETAHRRKLGAVPEGTRQPWYIPVGKPQQAQTEACRIRCSLFQQGEEGLAAEMQFEQRVTGTDGVTAGETDIRSTMYGGLPGKQTFRVCLKRADPVGLLKGAFKNAPKERKGRHLPQAKKVPAC